MRKREAGAAIVLGAFLLAGCHGGGPAAPARRSREPQPDAPRPARAAPKKPGPVAATLPVLSLDGLFGAEAVPEGTAPGRNLFAFEEDPAVVAERARQAEEARKQQEAAAKAAAKAAEERAAYEREHPPPPQPPPIPFSFIGYLGPPEARVGVFSMNGSRDLVLAKAGDRIQQRFLIKDVGFESAEIGFEGFTETQRIALTPGGN